MFMSAQEAAAELGVSLDTLYAYVSRKLIRSRKVPNTRKRQYWREDIERLRGNAAGATVEPLVPQSAITLITPEGPFYRGRSAIALAETETLESICAILWQADAPPRASTDDLRRSEVYDKVAGSLAGTTILERACALLPLVERANPRSYDLSHAGYCRTGAALISWFTAIVCDDPSGSDEPAHLRIGRALDASDALTDLIRRVLVIAADHELDPTTYAVRAVANTGVSAYQAVLAGLASSQGRRLTFGRWEALSMMVAEILESADPVAPVLRRVREGEVIHGFGSRVYPAGDPRATALLGWLDEVLGGDAQLKRLRAAIDTVRDLTGEEPDFVIPLSFLGRRLGQVGNEVILLRTARLGGWIAHAMEQYLSQDLVRPRTTYRGPLPIG